MIYSYLFCIFLSCLYCPIPVWVFSLLLSSAEAHSLPSQQLQPKSNRIYQSIHSTTRVWRNTNNDTTEQHTPSNKSTIQQGRRHSIKPHTTRSPPHLISHTAISLDLILLSPISFSRDGFTEASRFMLCHVHWCVRLWRDSTSLSNESASNEIFDDSWSWSIDWRQLHGHHTRGGAHILWNERNRTHE